MDAAAAAVKTVNTTPDIGAKTFPSVVVKIFTDTFSGAGAEICTGTLSHASGEVGSRWMVRTSAKIYTGAFSHAGAKICFRSHDQGRQINRHDHSGRRRASK
jgi:hypothetical protein